MKTWLDSKFDSWRPQLYADLDAENKKSNPQTHSYNMNITTKESIAFGGADAGLLACLGKMEILNASVSFDVAPDGMVSNIKLFGTGRDLYDFDYDGGPTMGGVSPRMAAEVQAGYPMLGNGGKVFKTEIDLSGN